MDFELGLYIHYMNVCFHIPHFRSTFSSNKRWEKYLICIQIYVPEYNQQVAPPERGVMIPRGGLALNWRAEETMPISAPMTPNGKKETRVSPNGE